VYVSYVGGFFIELGASPPSKSNSIKLQKLNYTQNKFKLLCFKPEKHDNTCKKYHNDYNKAHW
jgi:hypothetical protein